ncbi:MAG: CotH kinase family protein, partial [Chloroflexota bacterium]|nr:CotH kinase family protein [Chloroflexota bacterium]
MRIKSTRSTGKARLSTWWGARHNLTRFALAVSIGVLLAGSISLWYTTGGRQLLDSLIAPLRAEAQKTVEEVTVTNDLPTLYFDIGFAEFQALATQREEALQNGILLQDDDDWARAEIRFQGETIPVRLRLKGDWTDHLNAKKWSFRVKTRGDAVLLGMRSFSVQAPYTRSYLNEWLYYEDLRQAGILAPRYSFVNVVVNGESWGLYALEESFSKELLEAQGRRESVIVRFDEDLFWERRALVMGAPGEGDAPFHVDPIARGFGTPEFALVDEFNTAKIAADPVLEEQSRAALGLLRGFQNQSLTTSQVFDTALLGRYLAHANLWSARHGTAWHNVRYYYNPLTSRLEPIAYDALALCNIYAGFLDLDRYGDLAVMEAYAREVARISQPEYLNSLKATYGGEFERYRSILLQEFSEDELTPPWDTLARRQTLLQAALHPPQSVYAYQLTEPAAAMVELQVGNILHYPVVLTQLQVAERAVDISPDWVVEKDSELLEHNATSSVILRSAPAAVPQYVTLRIPAATLQSLLPEGATLYSNTLQLVTNLYGVTETTVMDVLPKYPPILSTRLIPPQPAVAE